MQQGGGFWQAAGVVMLFGLGG